MKRNVSSIRVYTYISFFSILFTDIGQASETMTGTEQIVNCFVVVDRIQKPFDTFQPPLSSHSLQGWGQGKGGRKGTILVRSGSQAGAPAHLRGHLQAVLGSSLGQEGSQLPLASLQEHQSRERGFTWQFSSQPVSILHPHLRDMPADFIKEAQHQAPLPLTANWICLCFEHLGHVCFLNQKRGVFSFLTYLGL